MLSSRSQVTQADLTHLPQLQLFVIICLNVQRRNLILIERVKFNCAQLFTLIQSETLIVTFQDSYRPPMSNRCSVKLLFPPQKSKHCNNCKTCHCQSGSNLGEVSKSKVIFRKEGCSVNLVRFCHTCQLVLKTLKGFARIFHFGSSVRDLFGHCGHSNYFVTKSPLFRQNW